MVSRKKLIANKAGMHRVSQLHARQDSLIRTKLIRPAVRDQWLARRRLWDLLDAGLSKRLTVISAPAGYGKTTVVAQWLDRCPMPSAWLSLDRFDSEPERFFRYLIAALRGVAPKFGATFERYVDAAVLPPVDYLTELFIADLAGVESPMVLVLDDFQTIESAAIDSIMKRLVQDLPEKHHLVVLTRAEPAWPLSLWRSRDWICELSAGELCFSVEEVQAFLAQDSARGLSQESIAKIHDRTEGWIAGLQIAKLSMNRVENPEEFVREFSDDDRLIVDYLMDEVLSRQPQEIQRFLAATALFERFCTPLCNFVLWDESAPANSRQIIDRIERRNLFLVPLDRERHWYRYHHLFQNLLRHNDGENLPPERMIRLNRRAGEWFAGQGLIDEALQYFLAAGDVDAAALLVEQNLHFCIDEDPSRRLLERWLSNFAESAENKQPALLVARGYLAAFHWDIPRLAEVTDEAETLLRDPAFPISRNRRHSLLGDVYVQRAFCLYWQGEAEDALRYSRKALAIIPRTHRYAHSWALMYSAGSLAIIGRPDKALHLLEDARAQDQAEGGFAAGTFLTAKAAIYYYQGNFNAVKASAEQMLASHETVPMPDFWRGYAYYFLGSVAYERNLLDTAAEHFRLAEQLRYRMVSRSYQDVLIGMALVAWAEGDAERARSYTAAVRSFAVELNNPAYMRISESFKIRMAMLFGDPIAAPTADMQSVDSNQFWLEIPSLTHAEYLARRVLPSNCDGSLRFINAGLRRAKRHHNTFQVIQYLAVKSIALGRAGRADNALKLLKQALRMAEPQGLVRTFVDRGPVMRELLQTLAKRKLQDAYLRCVIEAFDAKKKIPQKSSIGLQSAGDNVKATLAEDWATSLGLSTRQIDVLNLIGRRHSNKEIARHLHISTDTVKTHVLMIYRKLKVHKRVEARRSDPRTARTH
jgi:ATP/maltotriose-dependent transcriptional regulator MalT